MELIIIILLILIVLVISSINKKEYHDYYTECSNCNNKGYYQCRNCKNCGVCTTEFGDIYCVEGNENGPINKDNNKIKYTNDKDKKNNKDHIFCYKYNYGNIYPQYLPSYYNDDKYLGLVNDARFYPFLKTLDNNFNTNYYNTSENYRQVYRDPLIFDENLS